MLLCTSIVAFAAISATRVATIGRLKSTESVLLLYHHYAENQ
jgi:hypothetical protein